MIDDNITLYWDGRTPIKIDRETFILVRLMLEENDGTVNLLYAMKLVPCLTALGYSETRAKEIIILARTQWETAVVTRQV